MKTERTRRIPTRMMRGYGGLAGWVLLVANGQGKKWAPGQVTCAFASIFAFVAMHRLNKQLARLGRKRLRPSPMRLLAPGGIIAAESYVRPRKAPRASRPGVTARQVFSQVPVLGGFTRRTQGPLVSTTQACSGAFQPQA
jgi:hypothetical protein